MNIFQCHSPTTPCNHRKPPFRHKTELPLSLKLPPIHPNPSPAPLPISQTPEEFKDKFSIYSNPKSKPRNPRLQNFKTQIVLHTQRKADDFVAKSPPGAVFDVLGTPKGGTVAGGGGSSSSMMMISRKVKELLEIKISGVHPVVTGDERSLKRLYKSTSNQLAKGERKEGRLQTEREREEGRRESRVQREELRLLIREDIIKETSRCRERREKGKGEEGFNDLVGEKKSIVEFKKFRKMEMSRKKYSRVKKILDTLEKKGRDKEEREKEKEKNKGREREGEEWGWGWRQDQKEERKWKESRRIENFGEIRGWEIQEV